ncbi:alkane hydroxylase MAH1-like [Wolffia australiana]
MSSLMQLTMGYPELLLSLACFIFFFLFRSWGEPSTMRNWPILGMLPGLLSQLHRYYDWVTETLAESGCTFLFKGPWFSGMNLLTTIDPANVNHIFNTNFANYPKGDDFLEIFDILGDGIFNADSESWKSQRRAAHMLITEPKFKHFQEQSSRHKVENGLVPLLTSTAEKGTAVDLHDVFLRLTFDTTCNFIFGVDPGCLSPGLPAVPFAKAMDDAEEVLFFRHCVPESWWKLLRWLRVGEEKKMALAWKAIDDFILKQVSQRMKQEGKVAEDKPLGEELSPDLLTSYINRLSDVGGTPINSKFLRDTTLNLMLAGRDTTATALSWFSWVVSQHPEVEKKILAELETILEGLPESRRDKPIVFTAEDVSSAVYLRAALCESLRLFPPVPMEHKRAVQADVLPSGHKVEAKTKILINLYAMGRLKGAWGEDCNEFKPERWISEKGRLNHEPSYKFLSFNSGPRTCLGKEMAMTQMKVIAATIFYNFRIKTVPGHRVVPSLSIILHMKNGLLVNVEKRTEH